MPRADGRARAHRTLGPVADLERHLPPEWWRTLFNAVYLQTDGDVVENQANTAREVDLLIRAVGLEPSDGILDLCCGQGRHSLELARRGFTHVTGVDRSRYLVRLARKRAKQNALEPSFREGDARRVRLPERSFHCVCLLGNSFGYFDREEDDSAVLRRARHLLRPAGVVALDLVDGEWMRANFEPRSWEWIDQNHFVCRERSLAADGMRLISREVVTHAERGVIADQFYAERLYSRPRLEQLLENAGFVEIRFHEPVKTESDRNQDLGMLARRIFVTARAPRVVPQRRIDIPFPEVTVIMGDPRLPDRVKRDGVFNPEDLDTICRLKEGLAELSAYRFQYLDNHVALLAELRRNTPAFVLNLCDEGYNNEASMEAHVPALLEVLRIPYTGAGPACLAACYDKALVRAYAQALDIPVPMESYAAPDDQGATIPSVFPALVKPAFGDSSIGITQRAVVRTAEQMISYFEWLRAELPDRPVLIQEFLAGPEYSIGVIGNPGQGYTILPVLEVDYSGLDPELPPILSYESKWLPTSPYWTQIKYREARAEEADLRQAVDYSTLLFERLGCRDYARFDFRGDAAGEIKLLEVNPNPGWCWDGKLNLMAGFGGYRYADLLRMILETAQLRVTADLKGATRPAGVAA
jgi:D-alanine-D-alanine ligase